MAGLFLQNDQFRIAKQSVQSRYIKIELLNYQFQTVDSLEGRCTAGNITIDANSDLRRSGSITLVITDSTFEVTPGGRIFLDKYLRIWVGTTSLITGEISWSNCGIFIIDAPNYQYDSMNNTVTLSLLDLMAKLTGVRNGYIKGTPVSFPAGENIRNAMIAMLKMAGFENYIVEEFPSPGTIPIDLDFEQGATVYNILKGLSEFYPEYEIFFDVNGTFICQKIPTGLNDRVMVDNTLWNDIVTNENISVDFQNVKNCIEVYGRVHEPAIYTEGETTVSTSESSTLIALKSDTVSSYSEDIIYGFVIKNPGRYENNISMKINELTEYPVYLEDGKTYPIIEEESGEIYFCVQFKGTWWNWLGHLQAYGFAEDNNPESPFFVEGTVGRIRLPLYGDVYDNIYSDDLARQRAEYELYLHTRMNDTITLTAVPVYWLDVNILTRYTSIRNGSTELYLIKNVNMGLSPSDTMNVNLIRFYPNNAKIVNK